MPDSPRFRVLFDDIAWAEDLHHASAAGANAAIAARAALESSGVLADDTKPCLSEGPDGTRLSGCVKVSGEWIVHTDGSGTTGGPAGIAFVARRDGEVIEASLPLASATNQQAEILAATYALHRLPAGSMITVVSDSEYLVNGWNKYLPGWRSRGWRKRTGGTPKNTAHWRRLIEANERHASVKFKWTRGHAGTIDNERADVLAGIARHAATIARESLEGSGLVADDTKPCLSEGPDGPHLGGCVKVYVPAPIGPWGLVLALRPLAGEPVLYHLAFGVRHPQQAWQPSVYQVADRRLHASRS